MASLRIDEPGWGRCQDEVEAFRFNLSQSTHLKVVIKIL